MNTTESGLLAAILAKPEDDLPRLVYADFLDERNGSGDAERAEFIRVQVELAKCRGNNSDSEATSLSLAGILRHSGLKRREERLSRALTRAWYAEFGESSAVTANQAYFKAAMRTAYLFRRGFVASVRCDLVSWLSIGPSVVTAHPVEDVLITDREPMEVFSGVWCWGRSFTDVLEERHRLAERVFDRLSGIADQVERVDFASREAAVSAASSACLAWAKSAAISVNETCAANV
jgi:uncharacterized protein (TIGR02996 family)